MDRFITQFFVIEYMGCHRNSFISIVYRRFVFISVLQICQSKEIRFFGGIILFLIAVLANWFAWGLNSKLKARSEAIVFAATVPVKSSPAESGTDLFILHEGTKVSILSKLGDWSEVKISDGNRGWLPSSSIEII